MSKSLHWPERLPSARLMEAGLRTGRQNKNPNDQILKPHNNLLFQTLYLEN
jgi:hypothetical protein